MDKAEILLLEVYIVGVVEKTEYTLQERVFIWNGKQSNQI